MVKANSKDGLYFPVSIELTVCLDTLIAFANSSWLNLRAFLNSSTRFFTILPPRFLTSYLYINYIRLITYCQGSFTHISVFI